LSASVLRAIADELEAGQLLSHPPTFVMRRGLSVQRGDANSIVLVGLEVARAIHLQQAPIEVLVWAGGREPFSLMELALALPMIEPEVLEACLDQLHRAGLLERVR
jgi:hypothetical protein